MLKDPRVDPSVREQWILIIAAEHGHIEVVRRLLKDERVNPSGYGYNAIKRAIDKGYPEIVELLLDDSGVDPLQLERDLNWMINMYGTSDAVLVLYNKIVNTKFAMIKKRED